MTFSRYILIPALLLFLGTGAQAKDHSWNIDKDHSGFHFGVTHVFVPVRGYFTEYEGTVKFSADDTEGGMFNFDVSAKSVFTGNAKRDKHLLSADFFNANKFPLITFRSSGVKKTGDGTLLVKGMLTMKETSREITLPLTFLGSKPHPLMKGTTIAGFEGGLTINRLDYGVGNGKFADMGVVDKDVRISIALELLKKE